MYKLTTIFVFLFIVFSSQAQTTFQKAYGGTAMDLAKSVLQTYDGSYVFTGMTTSYGAGGQDVYVIKVNANGDTLWSKTFGGDLDNEQGFCVKQTKDSGYIVSGYTSSFADVAGDMYLIRLKSNGDTLWTRTYGGNGYEWGSNVIITSDNGFAIAGQTPAFGAGGFEMYLVKIDASGNLLWTKTYGESGLEIGYDLKQTADGGYIICGQIDSYGAGFGDYGLIKTDSVGNMQWAKTYGGNGEEYAVSVLQTADGGYMMAGSGESTGVLGKDMVVIKVNATGSLQWAKAYGGNMIDECNQIMQTSEGGFICVGQTFSFSSASDYDAYVVKIDTAGNMQWSRAYGSNTSGSANDYGYSIAQTKDGGFIIAGETYSYGVGFKNIYVIKTDTAGNSGCNQTTPATTVSSLNLQEGVAPLLTNTGGVMNSPNSLMYSGSTTTVLCLNIVVPNSIQHLQKNIQVEIIPNPTSNELLLKSDEQFSFEIKDIYGRSMLKGMSNTVYDISKLASGNYIIQSKYFTSKFVKL